MKAPLLLLCLVALAACGNTSTTSKDQRDRLAVDRLYPLRMGSTWTYDIDTGEGLPVLGITRVTRHDRNKVEVTSGSEPISYEVRPDGLYRDDRQAYLLKAPVSLGARWDAGGGATAEVLDVSKSVETSAGTFTGCVDIRETGGAAGKVVRTTYCPDIGPVEVESSMSTDQPGQSVTVSARLRGYDFSGAMVQ